MWNSILENYPSSESNGYVVCCFVFFLNRVQNFRLHPNAPENLQSKQSYEVYQINRMFNAGSKGQMLESNGTGNGNGIDIVRHGNGIVNEVQPQRKSSRRPHHHHHHHRHHHHEEEPYLLDNNFNNKNLIGSMADKQIILANGNWWVFFLCFYFFCVFNFGVVPFITKYV